MYRTAVAICDTLEFVCVGWIVQPLLTLTLVHSQKVSNGLILDFYTRFKKCKKSSRKAEKLLKQSDDDVHLE